MIWICPSLIRYDVANGDGVGSQKAVGAKSLLQKQSLYVRLLNELS